MKLERRQFLKKFGMAAAIGFVPGPMLAGEYAERSFFKTPERTGSFAIRNAYIITMDERQGDFDRGTLVVENGEITGLGSNIPIPPGMEIIEGRNHIVMPGLIDCHWHLWTSLLRSMAGNREGEGYFPLTTRFSRLYTPRDMEVATRFAAAEALSAGITTVADFNHNARNPDFVLASCRALADLGIRAEVQYGTYRDMRETDPTPFDGIKEVKQQMKADSRYRLLQLGLGSRGPEYADLKTDWERARDLGMRITIHAAQTEDKMGQIKKLVAQGLLAEDVNIIHANYVTQQEIKEIDKAGATVTMTPYSEMRIGFGPPDINALYEGNVNLALGVDSTALSGNANLFENMKLIQNLANANARSEFFMDPYEVLKMATINGARALGLEGRTGSLVKGKRADLIMLNRDDLNFSSGNKPRHLVVEATQPHNVDLVAVDGQILKRNGRLTQLNVQDIKEEAENSLERMLRQ